MSIKTLILGTGNAFSAHSWGSSCAIATPSGHVLVDCPGPIDRILAEGAARSGWKISVGTVTSILLTHLHGDHCNGLESVGFQQWLRRRVSPAPLPKIYASQAVCDRLWERLSSAMDQRGEATLADYFEVIPVFPGRPLTLESLTIEVRATNHSIPTIGLLIRAGTACLGWSSDTPFEQAHIDWLDQAQVIVHETTSPPYHTAISELNSLPSRIRGKMRLIHMPDDFEPGSTEISALSQGEVLHLD